MPIGAAKFAYQGYQVAAEAEITRPQTITAVNDAQLSRDQSKFGNSSLVLDGTGDYVYINGGDGTADFSGDFTIECWFRSNNVSSNAKIMDLRGINGAHSGGGTGVFSLGDTLLIDHNGSSARVYIDGANRATGASISNGTWYHLAIQRSSGVFNAWLNGTRIVDYTGSDDYTSVFEANQAIGMGASTGSLSQGWNGYIDEVRISVVPRYTNGASITTPTTAFVNDDDTYVLMHVDGFDGDVTILDDPGVRTYVTPDFLYVGNSIDGEYDTAQKKIGTSSWYNQDEYTALQLHQTDWSDSVGTGEFTIEMWLRRETKSDNTDYWIVDANSNETGLYYDVSANSLKFSTEGIDRITGGSLNTNTWYHVAVSRDSSNNTKLFINGTQSGSTTTANDRNWVNVNYWSFFGETAGYKGFKGHIDEMRISTVARYTSNFTAPSAAFTNDADTILLYHFEGADGTSTSIIDDNL